jgi:hypothetical protein
MSSATSPAAHAEGWDLGHDSVTTLVEHVSPSATSSETPDVGEPSDSQADALTTPAPGYLPPDQAALAWIDHVERGNAVPDGPVFVELLKALIHSRVPPSVSMAVRADRSGVKLKIVDTGKKFPHMLDTANGTLADHEAIWTQCKTKMTHFCVRLVDAHGQPVRGSEVHPSGLRLRLTLHKVSDFDEALDDDCNPRPWEGLFLGRASRPFESEVCLIGDTRHEFRFQVLLLSSDIGGARMYVKVAPVEPHLALNPNLTARSHSFISRARMPDEGHMSREKRSAAASHLLSMATSPSKRHCSPGSSDS